MGDFTKKLRGRNKRARDQAPRTPAQVQRQVERTTHALVQQRQGRLALRLVGELDDYVAAVTREATRRSEWECEAGCTYCCHLRVIASPPELARIAEAIIERPDAAALHDRIARANAKLEGMSEAQMFAARLPCPLLDASGRCSTYAVRPLACRAHVSMSRAACREAHEHPELDDDQDTPSTTDPALDKLRNDVDTHLAVALTNAGLDGMAYELTDGLARSLDALVDHGSAPETFAGCRVLSGSVEFNRRVHELIDGLG